MSTARPDGGLIDAAPRGLRLEKKPRSGGLRTRGEAKAWESTHIDKRIALALYLAVMIGVIVGLDVMFFKGRFWEQLLVNVGIVLVFGAFYLRVWGYSR